MNVLLRATVSALALAAAGCISSVSPTAAASLSCSEDQLEESGMGMGVHAKGCGNEDFFLYDYSRDAWVSLKERAAFELSCERQSVKMTVLDSMTFGVEGCGNKVVYKTVPYQGFVMNSASSEGKPATPKAGGGEAPKDDAQAL